MPLTLYSYILRELLKLMLTTTGVLVLLMSFGFVIKPISEGLLGPLQIIKVIGYAIPIMFTSALPFAAAFSSTLVFFRLSADNEVMACAASGISYRELLMPVLAVGLALTLSMFVMSNWVVPGFWALVSREIEQDVSQLVMQKINRREVLRLGKLIVYADAATDRVPVEDRPDGQLKPYNRMVLDGVAVGKVDAAEDKIISDYTAERAVVDLYRDPNRDVSYMTMMLTNVTVNQPGESQYSAMGSTERMQLDPQEIPSLFTQKPKFLSLPRLRKVAAEPERSPEVRDAKRKLVGALAEKSVFDRLSLELKRGELLLAGPNGEQYLITAPSVTIGTNSMQLASGGEGRGPKVEVRVRTRGIVGQKMEANTGEITLVLDELSAEPRFNVNLHTVTIIDPTLPRPGSLRDRSLRLLRFEEPILGPLETSPIPTLQGYAQASGSPKVMQSSKYLSSRISDLVRNILAQLHSRAATSVNCVLVLMLGAVMSMLLRGRVPLAIFFWCFVPTVLAFLTISSGQNLIESQKVNLVMGIGMTWLGDALLLTMILGVYYRLCRN
jgi:lipopolysaccharide export system permease protein